VLKQLATDLAKEKSKHADQISKKSSNHDDEFTLFPKLPLELRRKIWSHALPGARVLEIYSREPKKIPEIGKDDHNTIVPFLKACSESREVVMHKYRVIEGWVFGLRHLTIDSILCFDPKQDTVYLTGAVVSCMVLGYEHTKGGDTAAELREFRSIAFDVNHFRYWLVKKDPLFLKQWLPKMTKLQKLFVVLDNFNSQERDKEAYRGLPVRFIPENTKEPKYIAFLKKLWQVEVDTHPEMENLRNVSLEFVERKRDYRPPLLSEKINDRFLEV
jgi:hypothetical protein